MKKINSGLDSKGRKHGVWIEDWYNGKLYLSETYKHGKRCGLIKYRSFVGDVGSDYCQ